MVHRSLEIRESIFEEKEKVEILLSKKLETFAKKENQHLLLDKRRRVIEYLISRNIRSSNLTVKKLDLSLHQSVSTSKLFDHPSNSRISIFHESAGRRHSDSKLSGTPPVLSFAGKSSHFESPRIYLPCYLQRISDKSAHVEETLGSNGGKIVKILSNKPFESRCLYDYEFIQRIL